MLGQNTPVFLSVLAAYFVLVNPAASFSVIDSRQNEDGRIGACYYIKSIGHIQRTAHIYVQPPAPNHFNKAYAGGSAYVSDGVETRTAITEQLISACLGISKSNISNLVQNGADKTFASDDYIGFTYTVNSDENGVKAGTYEYDLRAAPYSPITTSIMMDISPGPSTSEMFVFESRGGSFQHKKYWIGFVDSKDDCPNSVPSISPIHYVRIEDERKNGKFVCGIARDGSTASFEVSTNPIFVDARPPILTGAMSATKGTDPGQPTATVLLSSLASASDTADPSPIVEFTIGGALVSGDYTFPIGRTELSARAVDHVGNTSQTKTFTVTVEDREKPTISVPADLTKPTDSSSATARIDVTSLASAQDNADPAPELTYWLGSQQLLGAYDFPIGPRTIRLEAIDESNNKQTASFTITVKDMEPPTITSSGNIQRSTDPGKATVEIDVSDNVTVVDNVSTGVQVVFKVGSTIINGPHKFPIGSSTVTVEAKDASNNSAQPHRFYVIVSDKEAPVIVPPGTQVLDAVPPAQTAALDVTKLGSVSDNSGSFTLRYYFGSTRLSGSYDFPIGEHEIRMVASDASGNEADEVKFVVKVRDIDAPVLTPPQDLVLNVADGESTVEYDVTRLGKVIDNHDSNISIVYSVGAVVIKGMHPFSLGETTVEMNAADSAGNKAQQKSFKVTVQDLNPPQVPEVTSISFSSDDAITLEGNTEKNARVVVTFADGKQVTVHADLQGHFSATSDKGQQNGQVSLVAYDAANNASAAKIIDVTVRGCPISTSLVGIPTDVSGGTAFTMEVRFSEPVTGFELTDFVIQHASLANLRRGDSGKVYWVQVTSSGTGDVEVFLPAGVIDGKQRNTNLASKRYRVSDLTIDKTNLQISRHLYQRSNLLLSSQPDISRFLKGTKPSPRFNVSTEGVSGAVHSDSYLGFPFWIHGSGSLNFSDEGDSFYVFNALGAHREIGPNLIIGGMLEADYIWREDGDAQSSGVGWLAGPYFAWQPDGNQPLYLDGKFLYGLTENSISPVGSYNDRFTTRRFLAELQLTGEWQSGGTVWTPFIDASYLEDRMNDYTDNFGNSILSQKVRLARIETGVDFERTFSVFDRPLAVGGGLSGIWSQTSGKGAAEAVVPSYEGWRGAMKLGIGYLPSDDTQLSFDAEYDGFGSNGYSRLNFYMQLSREF